MSIFFRLIKTGVQAAALAVVINRGLHGQLGGGPALWENAALCAASAITGAEIAAALRRNMRQSDRDAIAATLQGQPRALPYRLHVFAGNGRARFQWLTWTLAHLSAYRLARQRKA